MPLRSRDRHVPRGHRRREGVGKAAATFRMAVARLVASGERRYRDTETPEEETRVGES